MVRQDLRFQHGGISVFFVSSLIILLVFMVLAIDGGQAYLLKQKYQDAAEMAAIAAAWDILSEPQARAVQIAVENGVSLDSSEITVTVGYYDVEDRYGDFGTYKNFQVDSDPSTYENEALSSGVASVLNNAAIVWIKFGTPTFLAEIMGRKSVSGTAQAMAYGKRYLYLALGQDGIEPNPNWETGYALFRNGIIGSNGNVEFAGTERFMDNVWVETQGEVSGDLGKVEIININNRLAVLPINWEGLQKDAENNGKVFTSGDWSTDWKHGEWTNAEGQSNYYRQTTQDGYIYYQFVPAPGNHGGRTYYFDLPSGDDSVFLNIYNPGTLRWPELAPNDRQVWNFTMVCPCGVSSYPVPKNGPWEQYTQYGNVAEYGDDGIVRIFCKKMDGYARNWYTRYGTLPVCEPKGVCLRMDGRFDMKANDCSGIFYMRIVADSIYVHSPGWPSDLIIDGGFGPPDMVLLGALERSE